MPKYREIILKDGRKVFIDNKGNIVESGTFQQPTGEDGNTNKQLLASLPVDNNVQQAKVDLLNIDLGDSNKSDGSAIVETPVENVVRRTPATPRRRAASSSVRRTQSSTPAKVVDKRNNSTVTVTAPSKTTPSKLPEVTVTSTRTPKDSTKVDNVKTDTAKRNTQQTAQDRKQVLTKKTQNNTQQSNKGGNNKSWLNPIQIQEMADRQNAAFNELGVLDNVGLGATKTGLKLMQGAVDRYNQAKAISTVKKTMPEVAEQMRQGFSKINAQNTTRAIKETIQDIKNIPSSVRNAALDVRQSIINASRKVKDAVKNQANRQNTIAPDKRAQVIDRANKNNARVQQAQQEYNQNNSVLGKFSQYLEHKGMSYDRGPASRVKYETKEPQVIINSITRKTASPTSKPTINPKTVNPAPAGRNPKLGQRKQVLGGKNKHNKGKRK